jgi:hypothetical protein
MFILFIPSTIGIVFESKSGARENDRLFGGYGFFSISRFFASACVEEKDLCDVLFRL